MQYVGKRLRDSPLSQQACDAEADRTSEWKGALGSKAIHRDPERKGEKLRGTARQIVST